MKTIRILAIGDILGSPGLDCLRAALPFLRGNYQPNILIVNGENSSGGFGITKEVFFEFTKDLGVDVVTMGNHWCDKRDVLDLVPSFRNLVIPSNMYNVRDPNYGIANLRLRDGTEYAVLNLTGRIQMHDGNRCPFEVADQMLEQIPESTRIRVVDFHAEATSEKQALAHYLQGRVSLFYGTHTHCPTADERILGQYTGFITDIGMTGGYDSVIGMDKKVSIDRFIGSKGKRPFTPATLDPWLSAIVADIDPGTGACERIERILWERNGESQFLQRETRKLPLVSNL